MARCRVFFPRFVNYDNFLSSHVCKDNMAIGHEILSSLVRLSVYDSFLSLSGFL